MCQCASTFFSLAEVRSCHVSEVDLSLQILLENTSSQSSTIFVEIFGLGVV